MAGKEPGKGVPYRLTPRAESDLEEIWLYTFKTWSPEQADRYHNDIVDRLACCARQSAERH